MTQLRNKLRKHKIKARLTCESKAMAIKLSDYPSFINYVENVLCHEFVLVHSDTMIFTIFNLSNTTFDSVYQIISCHFNSSRKSILNLKSILKVVESRLNQHHPLEYDLPQVTYKPLENALPDERPFLRCFKLDPKCT